MATPTLPGPTTGRRWSRLLLIGPAFVAANLTAGANYGYLLVWVLVAANAMAVLVQHQSAKLGLVTRLSRPEILGKRPGARRRRLYWVQFCRTAAAARWRTAPGVAVKSRTS